MGLRLKELWDRYHFDDVNFQDETFFTKAGRVHALADQIVESGMKITWAANHGAPIKEYDCPTKYGYVASNPVSADCSSGVESGSNEVLKRIRKDIKIEQVYETAEKNAEVRHRRSLSLHRRFSRTRPMPIFKRLSTAPNDCAR